MGRIKWLIMVGGVICLVLFVGTLVWTRPGLDNYRSMLGRGDVVVIRDELTRELVRRPDWHQARRLMFELELEDGNPLSALEHLLVLIDSGHSQGDEGLALRKWMQDQRGDYPSLIGALHLTPPDQVWPRELALNLAMDVADFELVLSSLAQLKSAGTDNPMLELAWDMWNHRSLSLAWQMALELGDDYQAMVVERVGVIKDHKLKMFWLDQLLDISPGQPTLRIFRAGVLGGRQGLTELLDIEREGYLPVSPLEYGNLKFRLLIETQVSTLTPDLLRFLQPGPLPGLTLAEGHLSLVLELEKSGWVPADPEAYKALKTDLFIHAVKFNPGIVHSEILNWVEPWAMLDLAQYWLGSQEAEPGEEQNRQVAVATVLSRLEENDQWAQQVHYLRQAFVQPSPPRPDLVLDLGEQPIYEEDLTGSWNLSPNREHLFIHGFRTTWNYLPRGTHIQLPDDHRTYRPNWSPDGDYVALWPGDIGEGANHLWIYSLDTRQVTAKLDIPELDFLGWLGSTTLAFSRTNLLGWELGIYAMETQEWTWNEEKEMRPHLTGDGRIAWVRFDDVDVTVDVAGDRYIYRLPQGGEYRVYDWLPRGGGLVLEWKADRSRWLVLADGEVYLVDVWGFVPLRGGWRDQERVYGSYSLGDTNHLMVLDTKSMNLEHSGITGSRVQFEQGILSILREGRLCFFFLR